MNRTTMATLLAAGLALAGCAGTERATVKGWRPYPTPEIAALDGKVARETDRKLLPGLIFRRGHLAMEEGERYLEQEPGKLDRTGGGATFGPYFQRAIADFETIAGQYPDSPEAPEATYHLGVIHDYPDLSDFDTAVSWYRLVTERYPGTESARKARAGIARIEAIRAAAVGTGHGEAPPQ